MTHIGDGLLVTTTTAGRGWQTQFLEDGYTWTAWTENSSEKGTAGSSADAARMAQEAYDRLIAQAA